MFTLGRFFLAAVRACKQKRLHRLVNMPNSVLEGDNNRNEQDNEHEHDEHILDNLDELDANTWVATGEMQKLPTSIFKNNSLSPSTRKTILQSEPRNKDTSYHGQETLIKHAKICKKTRQDPPTHRIQSFFNS